MFSPLISSKHFPNTYQTHEQSEIVGIKKKQIKIIFIE